MKKLLYLILSFIPLVSFAVKYSGSTMLSDWTVPRGFANAPQIQNITLKWEMDDFGGAGSSVKIGQIQWFIGQNYVKQPDKYPISSIPDALNQFKMTTLVVKADVVDELKNETVSWTTFEFDGSYLPKGNGEWGPALRTFIDWNTVFQGVSADSAKVLFTTRKLKLANLQILEVKFTGEDFLKNLVTVEKDYKEAMDKGEASVAQKNWVQAALFFQEALDIKPNDEAATLKLNKAKAEIGLQKGDEAFTRKDYGAAKTAYTEALGFAQKDATLSNTLKTKIGDAEKALNKDKYDGLMREGDNAVAQKNYPLAKTKYEEAGRIFPTDPQTQNFIMDKLQAIQEAVAQANFGVQMQLGDNAFLSKNYEQAIGFYNEALKFMPGNPLAINKIKEAQAAIQAAIAYQRAVMDLTTKYNQDLTATTAMRNEALSNAARAYDANAEACLMEVAKSYACIERYIQTKLTLVQDEAAGMIYNDPVARAKANIPNLCIKPSCNSADNQVAFSSATTADLLTAAKRKYQMAQADNSLTGFREVSQNWTDQMLTKEPGNPYVITFAALLAQSSVDRMGLIRKALYLKPDLSDALQLKAQYEEGFMRELATKIKEGDSEYVRKAAAYNLLQNALWDGKTPAEHAIDGNKENILAQILGAGGAQSAGMVQPLLFYAVEKNSANCARTLLQYGAKADATNAQGETPMMLASRKGFSQVINVLGDYSADNESALLVAVENNNIETVKALLAKRANVDTRNRQGDNLLMMAIRGKQAQMVDLLMENGANINHENNMGENPLAAAAIVKWDKMVDKLLALKVSPAAALAVVTKTSPSDGAAFAAKIADFALNNNRTDLIMLAMNYNPALAIANTANGKPFILAAMDKGAMAVAEMLLDSDVDFNQPIGDTYLMIAAAEKGARDIIKTLLINGVNPDSRNKSGETALNVAARMGNTTLVEMLINGHSNIENADEKGYTPLISAVNGGSWDASKALLQAGAKTQAVTRKSQTALHFAVINKDVRMVETLLDAGADVNRAGDMGMTPLHFAAQNGSFDIARLLVTKGASKTTIDNYKRTPSVVASKYKYKDLAKFLKPAKK